MIQGPPSTVSLLLPSFSLSLQLPQQQPTTRPVWLLTLVGITIDDMPLAFAPQATAGFLGTGVDGELRCLASLWASGVVATVYCLPRYAVDRPPGGPAAADLEHLGTSTCRKTPCCR